MQTTSALRFVGRTVNGRLWGCIAAVVLLSLLASGARGEAAYFSEDVKRIARIPPGGSIVTESVRPRPHLGKMGYVYEEPRGFRVCLNSECSSPVEQVARGMPFVSADGNNVAAVVQKDGRARVMLNGSSGRGHDMVYALSFSPDSMKLAYIAQEDDDFFVYVNQDRHRSFPYILPDTGLIFSRDSKDLVYIASEDGEAWKVVKNGEPGDSEYEQVKHVVFSRDSSRLVYAAKTNGQWHLVENGQVGPAYEDIMHVVFCPQSETLAYIAKKAGGSVMVTNGEESEEFDHIPGEPSFSSDGSRLAYAVAEERRGGFRMRMVVDGDTGPAFDQIGAYQFSPDGSQFAYMAKDGEKGRMVVNGKKHRRYDSVGVPVFSPDGDHLAYTVYRNGSWAVKKDGQIGPDFAMVENPVFSPDGSRMAYLARFEGGYAVVEDDEVQGSYQWAGQLRFSPCGEHLAHAVAEEGESLLVIDGHKGEERFLSFLRGSPVIFTADDTVEGIALREGGRHYHHIRATIEK